ncbi:MAG: HAD family hydrolase [Evtepia gabavorous]
MSKVTFDKTGTLTFGTPQVVAVEAATVDETLLYTYAACAELRSEHPWARRWSGATARRWSGATARRWARSRPRGGFSDAPRPGVRVKVAGVSVVAGNPKLLEEAGIPLDPGVLAAAQAHLREGCTVIYCGVDGTLAGFLALSDTLRPQAAQVIQRIRAAGPEPVLLTGDNENAAGHIAGQLGIQTVRAGCLPEDKLRYIDDCQQAGSRSA